MEILQEDQFQKILQKRNWDCVFWDENDKVNVNEKFEKLISIVQKCIIWSEKKNNNWAGEKNKKDQELYFKTFRINYGLQMFEIDLLFSSGSLQE